MNETSTIIRHSLSQIKAMREQGEDQTSPEAESLGADFWSSARVVMPAGKTSVHLRLDTDCSGLVQRRWEGPSDAYERRAQGVCRSPEALPIAGLNNQPERTMSKQFFNTIMRGMEEARAYMEGARDGYRVTESPSMNAKSWAKLREAMSPESQARMDDRLKEALHVVPLDNTLKGS